MHSYSHKVQYYETDKMGITHHSNYIRFMEEARMSYLRDIGYSMERMEEGGITSPVVSITCDYRHTTTFGDELEIIVTPVDYTGARLTLHYKIINAQTGVPAAEGRGVNCFIDKAGKPVAVRKHLPEMDAALRAIF